MRAFVRTGLYLGIFSTLLVPLFFTESLFFPAITGKVIYFYAVVQISLVLYVVHIFIDRNPLFPHWSIVSLLLFGFVGVVGITSLLGENPVVSIFSNLERLDGFMTLLHLAVFFWLIISLLNSEKIWNRFFLGSLGVSVVVFVVALGKYLEIVSTNIIEARVDVFLGNATFLGAYAMLHVFVAGYLSTKQDLWSRTQLLLIGIALLNVATIIFSGTRAAFLGLLGGLATVFLVYFFRTKQIKFSHKLFITLGICVVLISSAGVAYIYRTQLTDVPLVGRLLLLSPETITEQPRYFIWKAAISGFMERPILGWGMEQYLPVYSHYYSPETRSRLNVAIGEIWVDRVHNAYLEWLVATGIVGIMFYLSLLGSLIYVLLAHPYFKEPERALLVGFVVAYMISNLFMFDSLSSYLLFFGLVGYIHFRAKPIKLNLPRWPVPLLVKKAVGVVLIIVTVWIGSITTIRVYATAYSVEEFVKADSGSKKQLEIFDKLVNGNTYAPRQVTTVLAEEVRVMLKKKVGEPAVVAQLVIDIEKQINKEVTLHNPDARALLVYCKTMREAGNIAFARELCTKAVESAPQTQEVLTELGQIYRDLKMYDESLVLLKKSFLSEPEYDPARIEYVAALLYVGETELPYEILTERYGTHLIDDTSLLMAYIHIGAFEDTLQIIEERIKNDPRNISYHLSRVSIYLTLGEKNKAIKAAEDLMNVDPSLKEAGETLIKQIQSGEEVLGSQLVL